MSVVGRAYVTVRAVTRQVQGDIEGGVDRALNQYDAKTAGSKLGENLGSGTKKGLADSKLGEGIDESLKRHDTQRSGRDAGTLLGEAIGQSLLEDSSITRAFRDITRRIDIDSDSAGQKIGSKLGSSIVSGTVLKLGTIGTVGLPVVSDALGAISGLTASATSLVGTLGPTTAAAAAVGGAAMTTLLTTIGTVALGLKTQTDELDEFKAGLRPLRDEFRSIGEDVQGQLFPALESAAARATNAFGPTLRRGMVQTAGAVGQVAGSFADLAEDAGFQQDMARIFRANANALEDFGDAGADTVGILATLGAEATPLTRRFSNYVSQVADATRAQVEMAQRSGALESFFDRAGDKAATTGDALGALTEALFNVFSAGMPQGDNALDRLNELGNQFLYWTESFEGQNALAEWFEGGEQVASGFGDLLVGLTEGLSELSGGSENARDTLSALGNALPVVGGFLGGLSDAARILLQALGPSIEQLGNLSPKAQDLGEKLGNTLAPAIKEVGPDIVDMVDSALDLADALLPVVDVIGDVAGVVTSTAAPALRGVTTILEALPEDFTAIVGAVAAARIAFNSLRNSDRFGPRIETAISGVRAEMDKAPNSAGRFRAGMSSAMGVLGGPWGLALTGATVGLGLFMQKQADAEQRVESLRSSLDEQTGALTRNSRELIAEELEKADAFKNAEELGINSSDVLRAMSGDTEAYTSVMRRANDAQRTYNASTTNTVTGARNVSAATADQADAGRDLANAMTGLKRDTDSAVNSQRRIGEAIEGARGAARSSVPTFNNARSAVAKMASVERQFGNAAQAAAIEARGQAAAQRNLTRATYAYHEAASKAMQGTIGLEQSIDDAAKEMRQGAKTFNINTQAGRDNKLALIGIADAAAGVEGSARKQNAALERGRNQIIKLADAGGMGTKAAERFADKLISVSNEADKVPKEKTTQFNTPGLDSARSNARNYKTELDNIPESVHTTITEEHRTVRSGRAGGGWIRGPGTGTSDSIRYGNYDVSNREFIVNAADAARNARLLEAINAGVDVQRQGMMGQTTVIHNNYVTVNNPRTERTSDSIPGALRRSRDMGLA